MKKIYKPITFSIIILLIFLTACSKNTSSNKSPTAKATTTESTTANEDSKKNEGTEFLKNFSNEYPNYTLLDYKFGSDENNPILLTAVAKNKESKLSNILFIIDENGVGQLELNDGKIGIYRSEDGLKLKNNKIFLSLDILTKKKKFEIHDFEISVIRKKIEKDVFNTTYKSNETIRKN